MNETKFYISKMGHLHSAKVNGGKYNEKNNTWADEERRLIPVTVIEAGPCAVIQHKTEENDGYNALVVGFDDKRENLANKPTLGRFKKAGVPVKRFVKELKLEDCDQYEVGSTFDASTFEAGEKNRCNWNF